MSEIPTPDPSEQVRSPWAPPEGWRAPDSKTTKQHQSTTVAGQVVSIPESEFKGNPQRAIGHPSNPTTPLLAAFAEQEQPTPAITEQPKQDQAK